MKHSIRQGAGFLEIDHTDSPGLTEADIPPHLRGFFIPVGKGQRFRTDVYTCSHCERNICLHAPAHKFGERGFCPKCYRFICNRCEALRVKTGDCVPWWVRMGRLLDHIIKYQHQADHPDAVVTHETIEAFSKPAEPRIYVTDATIPAVPPALTTVQEETHGPLVNAGPDVDDSGNR